MNYLVTGAAGFIGSHLCKKLIRDGAHIVALDAFTDFYSRSIKENNIKSLINHPHFELMPVDILETNIDEIMNKVDVVFHFAAQPGVRTSWGSDFSIYTKNNIDATQRLLEAAKKSTLKKFIYASSSSVYGLSPLLPMKETSTLHPYSPYGVTKLAAENLCFLYYKNYGIPCVSLRFFTVYGPGQRPDMAFHKFFKSILLGEEITVFGDGQQTRDFTFIDDIIWANLSSIENGRAGENYNLGGGTRIKLADVVPIFEHICKKKVNIRYVPGQKGDVRHTFADIQKAKNDLKYIPKNTLEEGLGAEWDWIKTLNLGKI
ncbi:MAG: GDP-mannose 4,6-dehydratase [Candidatus Aminicenantes bacterium]|nr:MAG: GDP-mannose 4,6-dehydratase [Candidatus Aminicenantes bacterium]